MDRTYKPAVLTIGDELIFGEKQNTNQQWIASALWKKGIPTRMSLVLPDDVDAIAQWIKRLVEQQYYPIFVSGGIGGTHDDCTRQGIANGLEVDLTQHKECLVFLKQRAKRRNFQISPQVERMTFLPNGSELIDNETGMPGFSLNGVYAFPGFPSMLVPMATIILEDLIPGSNDNWITREVVFPVAESVIGPHIESFLKVNKECIIGIYPDSKQCHHQVTVKFRVASDQQQSASKFDDLVIELNHLIGKGK